MIDAARSFDRAGVLEFAQSVGGVAYRPGDERERIGRDPDAMLPAGPFAFPIVAQVNWAVRA